MQVKFQNITKEELTLRRIFDDPIIQNKAIPHIDMDLFEDASNRTICKALLENYDKYKKFTQAQDLVYMLPDNSAEKSKLLKIMGYDLEKIDRKMSIDVVEDFFKEKKTVNVLTDAAESIHNKDFKNIKALIQKLEDSVNFSLYLDIGLDLVEDTTEALRRLNETQTPIPSSISDINAWTCGPKRNTSGGYYPKALTVYMGMPNVGKTIILCNDAAYAYQCGYNVLYVSLEIAEELIWERVASNVTDNALYDIRELTAGNIEQALKDNKKRNAPKCGEMVIRQMPSTTTVLEIENLINEIKVSKGFDIDILFVDYLGKMKPASRKNSIKNSSLYTEGKEVSEQLRDMAIVHEIPVVTASQLNRDGYDNTQSGMKNTAGSAGVNDTADLMITITQDPWLAKYGLFLHTIIKNRFGQKLISFISECAYSFMRVRSANAERVKQYSDAQISQSVELSNHNQRQNYQSSADISEDTKNKHTDKNEDRKKRFKEINQKYGMNKDENENVKKDILDNSNINNEENKKKRSGVMNLFS